MSNMVILRSWIEGTRPLLWNAFSVSMLSGYKKLKTGSAGNNPEEWKQTVLATPERRLFVKGSYLYSCLREAARFTKEGRGTLQRSVAATLQILDEEILVDSFIKEEMFVTTEAFITKNKYVYLMFADPNPQPVGKTSATGLPVPAGENQFFPLF